MYIHHLLYVWPTFWLAFGLFGWFGWLGIKHIYTSSWQQLLLNFQRLLSYAHTHMHTLTRIDFVIYAYIHITYTPFGTRCIWGSGEWLRGCHLHLLRPL